MISCRKLTVRYGGHAVLDVAELDVRAGERVALFGLNGAGKTTLLRCLLGLARHEGEASIGGLDPGDVEARARLAYVPQRPPRFDLDLSEFLATFSELRGIDPGRVRARARELGLDLAAHGPKRLEELSGGMLQKAVVALALASEAPALLLDEPTANLDPGSRRELLAALGEATTDRTVLVTSHRFEDVVSLAERAVVLDRGRVVFDGTMRELCACGGSGRVVRLAVAGSDPGLVAGSEPGFVAASLCVDSLGFPASPDLSEVLAELGRDGRP